jgi:hypothetical protein
METPMTRRTLRSGARLVAFVGGLILVGSGALYGAGTHVPRVKQVLKSTSNAPAAGGKVHLATRSASQGRFSIIATHLAADKSFDVIVGGVKVGVLQTSAHGGGRLSFSTHPRRRDILLGFDPHGKDIVVRDQDDGDDVLVGHFPDHHPGEVACCLADDGAEECESLTEAECRLEGGTPIGVPGGTAASCAPNPCATTSPPDDEIVCCTNATHDDENEAECEQLATEAKCANAGGMVIDAASCAHNPCKVTPPSNAAACCIAATDDDGEGETECEVVSAEACIAAGGIPAGTPTCSHHPCRDDGGGHHGNDGDDDGGDDQGGDDQGGGHHGGPHHEGDD